MLKIKAGVRLYYHYYH